MLTDKQQNFYDTLVTLFLKGKHPTIKEIQLHFWYKSKRSVTQYLEILERDGYITRSSWYRGILLKNSNNQETIDIPILWVTGKPLIPDPRIWIN